MLSLSFDCFSHNDKVGGIVSDFALHVAVRKVLQALLPIVHDQLHSVPVEVEQQPPKSLHSCGGSHNSPESDGVAGVDDEPHESAPDAGEGPTHDAGLPGEHQPALVSEQQEERRFKLEQASKL